MEKYSSGRRGAPAKGIGRLRGARSLVQVQPGLPSGCSSVWQNTWFGTIEAARSSRATPTKNFMGLSYNWKYVLTPNQKGVCSIRTRPASSHRLMDKPSGYGPEIVGSNPTGSTTAA